MDEKRLASLPLFAELSRAERRTVAAVADEIDLPAGKELIDEGEFAYEFFAIEDGRAKVSVGGAEVAELGPGDFFGEMGVLGGARRNATVVAASPLTAVVMTGRDLRSIEREMPQVHSRLCAAIEERTRAIAGSGA